MAESATAASDPSASAGAASSTAALLSVNDITMRFGGIVALDGVTFNVPTGEIVGLIGPNGAGKTTLFNCLSRLYTPNSGEITFDGQSLLRLAPHRIAAIGIGRTFQNLALFGNMTVLQNVMVGIHCRTRGDYISNALGLPLARREEREMLESAHDLIDYLNLNAVMNTLADGLPFGTRKRVELARALAGRPRLLLLDEPAGGLNHEEVEHLVDIVKAIRDDRGMTVLLVEHHMNFVMNVSDKVVALDFGRKIADGTPAEVQANAEVIRAYLGGGS